MKRHFFANHTASRPALLLGLLGGLVVSTSVVPALGNIRLSQPIPRSNADSLKTGPCGDVAGMPGVYTKVAQGADVMVKFEETMAHEGCYQVAWSKAGGPFQVVAQVPDPGGSQGMQTITVKAPNESCPECVLQLRQITLGGPCTTDAGPQVPGASDTYYSCADVCVGDTCPPPPVVDAGSDAATSSSGGGASSGGPTTTRPDAGEPPREFDDTGGTNDGCNTSGVGGAAGGVLVALGLMLARRRRSSST
jgi:uncharacterized protein (TIGR03382 family)